MGVTEGDFQLYILDVDVILGNCTIPFVIRILTKDQPPPSNLVVYSTMRCSTMCVCVSVFSSHSFWTSSSLDVPAGVTQEEGHTRGRSHRISHPPSFCGACLNFSREKDSAIPLPRRP